MNQHGDRVYGHEVNTLTVMATESYVDFVDNFQKEIESETGIKFGVISHHSLVTLLLKLSMKRLPT